MPAGRTTGARKFMYWDMYRRAGEIVTGWQGECNEPNGKSAAATVAAEMKP
jgi:hypothetical protein